MKLTRDEFRAEQGLGNSEIFKSTKLNQTLKIFKIEYPEPNRNGKSSYQNLHTKPSRL